MAEKHYYLAYGSNLSVDQMAYRCPDARIAGKALLKDWKLAFKVHADVVPCMQKEVPVLIWEISKKDEKNLDLYEGYANYYIKKKVQVSMTDLNGEYPETVTAMMYVMTEGHPLRMPTISYYDVLAEGYSRFGFDSRILEDALKEASENDFS